MDLSSLDVSTLSNNGREVEILHPTKRVPLLTEDGQKITITVIGKYSDEYQKIMRGINNRRLAQRGGRVKITAEELESELIETLAKCIKSWNNVVLDGKVLDCTYANAVKVLSDPRLLWMREQLEEEVNETGNFIKA